MTNPSPTDVLRRILADIEPWADCDSLDEFRDLPDIPERLPLPYMVLATLLCGTNCQYALRPFEKTEWSVHLRFKEIPMRLEEGKFGMSLATVPPVDLSIVEDFINVLGRAFSVTDQVLQPWVEQQIRKGEVTVGNVFPMLDARYRCFREQAGKAYASEPTAPINLCTDDKGRPTSLEMGLSMAIDLVRKPGREGFYYGSACLARCVFQQTGAPSCTGSPICRLGIIQRTSTRVH